MKLLIFSNFTFSYNVFLKLLSSMCKNVYIWRKGITEKSLQVTILNLIKMEESSSNRNSVGKEKLPVTNNFSFSHSVFKILVMQTHLKYSLFGKGFIARLRFCGQIVCLSVLIHHLRIFIEIQILQYSLFFLQPMPKLSTFIILIFICLI